MSENAVTNKGLEKYSIKGNPLRDLRPLDAKQIDFGSAIEFKNVQFALEFTAVLNHRGTYGFQIDLLFLDKDGNLVLGVQHNKPKTPVRAVFFVEEACDIFIFLKNINFDYSFSQLFDPQSRGILQEILIPLRDIFIENISISIKKYETSCILYLTMTSPIDNKFSKSSCNMITAYVEQLGKA
ncbi:MAG: hypothetical protein M3Q64_02260 [bacterium]|nr:hypothetical protein [bacterium]